MSSVSSLMKGKAAAQFSCLSAINYVNLNSGKTTNKRLSLFNLWIRDVFHLGWKKLKTYVRILVENFFCERYPLGFTVTATLTVL